MEFKAQKKYVSHLPHILSFGHEEDVGAPVHLLGKV